MSRVFGIVARISVALTNEAINDSVPRRTTVVEVNPVPINVTSVEGEPTGIRFGETDIIEGLLLCPTLRAMGRTTAKTKTMKAKRPRGAFLCRC